MCLRILFYLSRTPALIADHILFCAKQYTADFYSLHHLVFDPLNNKRHIHTTTILFLSAARFLKSSQISTFILSYTPSWPLPHQTTSSRTCRKQTICSGRVHFLRFIAVGCYFGEIANLPSPTQTSACSWRIIHFPISYVRMYAGVE